MASASLRLALWSVEVSGVRQRAADIPVRRSAYAASIPDEILGFLLAFAAAGYYFAFGRMSLEQKIEAFVTLEMQADGSRNLETGE